MTTQTLVQRDHDEGREFAHGLLHLIFHNIAAMLGPLLLFMIVLAVLYWPITHLGLSRSWLFDVPYSPICLVISWFVGFFVNAIVGHKTAKFAWIGAAIWLLVGLLDTWNHHDPRWCEGCSRAGDLWDTYFSATKLGSDSEGLPKFFMTAPAINAILYSWGAVVGYRKFQKALSFLATGHNPE
jgi:hypothetical protein